MFAAVSDVDWKNVEEHVNKIANEYWKRDALMEDAVEELIISVGTSDSDTEES